MALTPPPSAPPAAPSAPGAAPQRGDPSTFRGLADSFVVWLVGFRTSIATLVTWLSGYITWAGTNVTELSALQTDVAAKQSAANTSASTASAAASSASSDAAVAVAAKNEAVAAVPQAQLADYTALRAYAGVSSSIRVTGFLVSAAPSGIAGDFTRDDSDTTSTDNGGTIIVSSSGKRWKRVIGSCVMVDWFGTNAAAVQAAVDAASVSNGTKIVAFGAGTQATGTATYYDLGSTTITITNPEMKITGPKYTQIRKTGAGAFFDIPAIGEGFEIENLWLRGDNTAGQIGVLFSGANNGSYMQCVLNASVHDCWFEAVGSKTVVTETAGGAIKITGQTLGLAVERNICSQGGYLIRCEIGSDGIRVSNNVCNISRSVAVQFENTAGAATVEISNNNLATVGGAVFLKASGYCNVYGNTCIPGESEAGALGAVVKRTINGDGSVSLTEDAATGVSAAFWLSSAQPSNISQNVCSFGGAAQNSDVGVYLSNVQAACFVSNNLLTGYGTSGIRVWAGQPHILVNNRSNNTQKDTVYSDTKHPGILHQYTVAAPYSHSQGFGTAIPAAPFEFSTPGLTANSGFMQVRVSDSANPNDAIGFGYDTTGGVGYIQAYRIGTGYRSIRHRSPSLFLGGSGDTSVIVQAGSGQGSTIFQVMNNAGSVNYLKVSPLGRVFMTLSSFADNAAASGAGLVAGELYKTATGEVRIVV